MSYLDKEKEIAYKKAYRIANKDKIRAYARTHYAKNKSYWKKWYVNDLRKNPNRVRESRWKTRGVLNVKGAPFLIADYEKLLKDQEGVCAICHNTPTKNSSVGTNPPALVVDHNHQTGQVRGLLCTKCNNGLGAFGDNPNLLQTALSYLTYFIGFSDE